MPPPAGLGKKPHVARPPEVTVAVYLWIASLVVGLVGSGVSFSSMHGELDDALREEWANTSDLASLDTGLIATIALVSLVALGVAVRTFLIVKLAGGRRWARTILTALGAFSVVGAVLEVSSAAPVTALLSVLDALLIAAAIVYLFSDGAKPYYAP